MSHLDERANTLRPPGWNALLVGGAPILAAIAISLLVHFVVAPRIGDFRTGVMLDIGINIALAVSLNMVNGFTGQFSIGHAGFMALGAYTGAAITYYGSAKIWEGGGFHGGVLSGAEDGALLTGGDALFVGACLAGGVVAAIAGLIVGLPSLRLRGDYLAIVTLGFGEIVRILLQQSQSQITNADRIEETPFPKLMLHLGQALGFRSIPRYTTPFWVGLAACLTVLVAFRLKRSSYGRAFLAIRENEIAAEAVGVPVTRYKVMAFVIAAFFAGVAGSLAAHQLNTISADSMGFIKSFDLVIMVVLGGMGSISGAIVAATALTILPEWLREPTHVWPLGLAIVIVMAIVPRWRRRGPIIGVVVATILFEIVRYLAGRYDIQLSEYRMIFYALSLILVMILRPQGIFGLGEIWDFRWRKAARA